MPNIPSSAPLTARKTEMSRTDVTPLSCAEEFLRLHRLTGRQITVALSGGADSAVLLSVLATLSERLGLTLSCIHVNHRIRGEEADRDEAFCRRLCDGLGVPLAVKTCDVPAFCQEAGVSQETGARMLRYAIFDAYLEEHPEAYLATAHNADDNAETVLFRMARGTGLAGLGGIPPVRGRYIRPLLAVTAAEIRTYARDTGLSYVLDSTNLDLGVTRNYIRAEILPRMEQVHGGATLHISSMVERVRRDEEYLVSCARALLAEATQGNLRSAIREAPDAVATRAIRLLYEEVRRSPDALTQEQTEEALALIRREDKSLSMTLPQGIVMHLWGATVRFCEAEEEHYPCETLHLGFNRLAGRECAIVYSLSPITEDTCPEMKFYKQLTHASCLSATIDSGLYVREKRDGDHYRFGGMTRKLKKLFCDSKLSPEQRRRLPVICDGEGILWVPGYGVRDADEEIDAKRVYLCYMTEEVHD